MWGYSSYILEKHTNKILSIKKKVPMCFSKSSSRSISYSKSGGSLQDGTPCPAVVGGKRSSWGMRVAGEGLAGLELASQPLCVTAGAGGLLW